MLSSILPTEFFLFWLLYLSVLKFPPDHSLYLLLFFFTEDFYLLVCFKHDYDCSLEHFYDGHLKVLVG